MIIESTYGVSRHLPREEREQLFLQKVHNTVRRGGRVLLPVVALGRSQVWGCVREVCVCVCVLQSTISRKGRTPWAHGTRTLVLAWN